MKKPHIMCVFGTRPDAVKMCPLVLELKRRPELRTTVTLTAQHREMLDQVMQIFGVQADYDLQIMRPVQTLTTTADAGAILAVTGVYDLAFLLTTKGTFHNYSTPFQVKLLKKL